MQLFEALVAATDWPAPGDTGDRQCLKIQNAIKPPCIKLRGWCLIVLLASPMTAKRSSRVVADIYAVGDKIKAEGDPYMMAAFDEIVGRSKEVWEAINNGPQDNGTA
jgi:hypothetical protein